MSNTVLGPSGPVRDPRRATAPVRTKRAWVLWLLTFLIPGGAQVVAGNRRLGRIALSVTITVWAALVAALLLLLIRRDWLISVIADPNVQLVAAWVLAALAVGWAIIFLNTYSIIRPGLLAPGMKVIVTAAVVIAVVVGTGVLGYGSYVLFKGRSALSGIFASGAPMKASDGRYNILVMGGDAGTGRLGLRPDSSAVWSIDAKSGRIAVISIPRNLQNAPFPKSSPMHKIYPEGYNCGDECIFNSIYPTVDQKYKDLYPGTESPGAQATMEAASSVTGLDVGAYVVVDMAGFRELIDALGGVNITAGGWVPVHGKYWEGTQVRNHWYSPGKHHFTGHQALWYARSRDFTSDYHRIRRQQCIQQAMINQFTPSNVLTKFTAIMETGEDVIHTSLPQKQLGDFVNLADKARKHSFLRLTLGAPDFGTAADKFSTYPDYDQIHTRVGRLVERATDSGAAKDKKAAEEKKAAEASKKAEKKSSGASTDSSSGTSSGGTAEESGSALKKNNEIPTTQPDGSAITEEYLVQLEVNGQTGLIEQIVQNNDACKPE
ncbi:LCP family protein [Galactobacter sp.]|uniref:LCP family protein n=1 Tax=Galactobacter sp. TaxID=2676125 RepID=UPI0025BDAB95|nr:LCP family protein [Galactobacter sp.]